MIKLVVLDFDGVFTDGKVTIDNNNEIIKTYNVKDGLGLKLLKNNNIEIGVISGYKENNSQLQILKHLNIKYYAFNNNKLQVLKEWIKELSIDLDNVAYMGDDLNDLEIMNNVRIVGCPKNAVNECLKISNFISNKNGGEGCIREFCDFILNNNNNKVSALICIKYFSKRLKNKNLLSFGNTTLINNKIDMMLSLDYINEIIINSESDIILDLVKSDYGNNKKIKFIKRDENMSLETTESKDFCRNVAKSVSYDIILYTPITCPLIKKITYEDMYKNYIKYGNTILISDGIKGEGHSGEKHNYCFGSCIISKEDMIKEGDTITEKYHIQTCDRIERIDIDYYDDYKRALYYYHNPYEKYDNNILQYLSNTLYDAYSEVIKKNKIKLLDCTLRDGGFVNNWNYNMEYAHDTIYTSDNIGINYIEIGYKMNNNLVDINSGIWRNCNDELIKKVKNKIKNSKISIMMDNWRYNFDDIEDKKTTGIDLVRVCNYIRDIEGTLKNCKILKNKGYETSVNIIASSYLSNLDLIKIKAYMISEDYVDYYYFADSFGNMDPSNVERIVSFFKNDSRTSKIQIGLHCHNNNNMAMSNTIKAIECGIDMIDGTYFGEGRGGGNLNLENIILYLTIKKEYNLNLNNLFDFLNTHMNSSQIDNIRQAISGLLGVHPYRLKKYDLERDLNILYNNLNNLSIEEKLDYNI